MNEKLAIPSDPCWKESIFAIKSSLRFGSFENFKRYLIENLPQNSLKTRKRYASYVLARFFPNQSLEQLSVMVWKSYHQENILLDIMRFEFLKRERLIALFIEKKLSGFAPGNLIPKEVFLDYLTEIYGVIRPKVVSRFTEILRSLGYLGHNNLISKYIVADQLEQITTRYSLKEFIERKIVL